MNGIYTGKKILVIGLAKSGLAAIHLLLKLGADDITVCERKEVTNKEELEALGVKVVPQTDELFEEYYDLVVKNPGVKPIEPFVQSMKARGLNVITEIELAYQVMKPQHIVAITGTNGKTTTTTLVYELLKKAYGDKAHVGGNIDVPLAEVALKENLLEEEGHYISLEISNAQLVDIKQFAPEVSVIVNMTPDHIDFMGGLDKYYESKVRVYENMDEHGVFLENIDDPVVQEYVAKYPPRAQRKKFSIHKPQGDGFIKDGLMVIDGEVVLSTNDVRIPGEHNLQNVLISAMAAKLMGVRNDMIREVVSNFKGVEHRIEFVREIDGVKYYNDSKATNTDATITALKSFDKGIILLVGGYEKGLSVEEVKKYLGPVKKVIGFGTAGERIATDLVGEDAVVVHDLPQAVNIAKENAVSGDIVLLSPTTSSFDQYHSFEERGEHFKKIVNAL